MSEASVAARKAMKAKAERMGGSGDPHQKVDASSWTPPPPMNTSAPTGPRPVSKRRNYKSGGHVEGMEAKHHAGRRPRRAAGGKALIRDWENADVKEANEDREGIKHEGGMKRGGRAKRGMGGVLGALPPTAALAGMVPTSRLPSNNGTSLVAKAAGLKKGGEAKRAAGGEVAHPHPLGNLGQFAHPAGGREARKNGGELDAKQRRSIPKSEFGEPGSRKYPMPDKSHAANAKARASEMEHKGRLSKGEESKIDAKADRVLERKSGGRAGKDKMNVNIVIAPGGQKPPMAPAPPMMPPGALPPPPRPPMPTPGMAGPPGMPPGMPPGGPPPMMPPPGRKRGGLVDGGAGGGLGRLEKIEDYGKRAKELDGHY